MIDNSNYKLKSNEFFGSLHAQISIFLYDKTNDTNIQQKILNIYQTVKINNSDDSVIYSYLDGLIIPKPYNEYFK